MSDAPQNDDIVEEDNIKDIIAGVQSQIEGFQTPAAEIDITKKFDEPKPLYEVLPEVQGNTENQLFGSNHGYAMPQAAAADEPETPAEPTKMEPPVEPKKEKAKKDKKYKVKF